MKMYFLFKMGIFQPAMLVCQSVYDVHENLPLHTVDGRNLHQLIGSLSHYLQGFIHPRWCRISSINSQYYKSNHVELRTSEAPKTVGVSVLFLWGPDVENLGGDPEAGEEASKPRRWWRWGSSDLHWSAQISSRPNRRLVALNKK